MGLENTMLREIHQIQKNKILYHLTKCVGSKIIKVIEIENRMVVAGPWEEGSHWKVMVKGYRSSVIQRKFWTCTR